MAARSGLDGVVGGDVDGEVGAEAGRGGEPVSVAWPLAGDHDEPRPGVVRRRRRAEPTDAGAEDGDDVTGRGAGEVDRPADARTERVEHRGQRWVERVGHGQQHRVGSEVEVRRVAAPETRRALDVDEPDHRRQSVATATSVAAGAAGVALAAGLEHLDGDALAGADTPPLRGADTYLLDRADHFVTRDEGVSSGDVPGVLLVIRAAQPACLDAQQPVVLTDRGNVEAA